MWDVHPWINALAQRRLGIPSPDRRAQGQQLHRQNTAPWDATKQTIFCSVKVKAIRPQQR